MSSKKSPPPPQLARKLYSLDGASDSDSDGDLEIIMPSSKKSTSTPGPPAAAKTSKAPTAAAVAVVTKKKNANNKSSVAWEFSSDDSEDDEIMAMARATLASGLPKHAPKRNASKTSSSLSSPKAVPRKKKQASPKAAVTTARKASSLSSPDSQGEETKKLKKTQAAEARLQQKRDTELRKQREKEARAQQRDEQRQAKERQKQLEKESKQQQKVQNQQASGHYAHQEIAVLMDEAVYDHPAYVLVETFAEDFLLHSYTSALTCPRAVQWIRKDYLQGGAKEAVKCLENGEADHYEHLPNVMLVMEADDFIPLLQRGNDEDEVEVGFDEFKKLQQWLDAFIARWQHVWKTTTSPKLILLLHQIPEALDRIWVDYRRQTKKKSTTSSKSQNIPSPPTQWNFEDATQWLLIQHRVECVLCPTVESVQSNFHKMTRGLTEARYVDQVTELQCVKKIKANTSQSQTVDDFDKAKDVWTRQLQMLSGVSEQAARTFAQSYPTAWSLWRAYNPEQSYQLDDDDDDNNYASYNAHMDYGQMVAGNFSKARRHAKLSQSLYRVMTSNDPDEMIL